MGIKEIILIIVVSIFVIGVIAKSIIDKRHGKCSCDGCDGNCSRCVEHMKQEVRQQLNKQNS